VLALDREEFPVEVRKSAVFPLLDPVEILLRRKLILVLAGHPAGMAPHTFRRIDEHPVSNHLSPDR
jgi:hypothetical protein